jgi:DNA-binding NtrC family response regulator
MRVPATEPSTIILVDDAPAILSILERALLLAFPNHRILAFNNAEDALVTIQRHPAALLVTDYNLADMDGLILSSRVRALFPSIYIVLVTAHTDHQLNERMRFFGVDTLLQKPFSLGSFEHTVRNALGHPSDYPAAFA